MAYGKVSNSALMALRQLWMRMHWNGHLQLSMKTRRSRTLSQAYQDSSIPMLFRIRPRQSFPLCLTAQPPTPSSDPVSYNLLKTSIPGTSSLTEEHRKRRLRVCLKSLWCCGKAYDQQREEVPLPSYFRIVFASPEMTYCIQTEHDLAACIIGRCFGALVAKKLSADITSRIVRVNDGILVCLSAILGIESPEAMSLLGRTGAIELASIISLMLLDADTLVGDTMPSVVLDVFKQTLRILSKTLRSRGHGDLSLTQVAQFHEIYFKALKYELQEISEWLPPISSYVPEEIEFPEPGPTHGSWTDVSQQLRENEVRIGGAPDISIGDVV
ncbi:hypothetical protein V8E53_004716 [Lactarius tabidus]